MKRLGATIAVAVLLGSGCSGDDDAASITCGPAPTDTAPDENGIVTWTDTDGCPVDHGEIRSSAGDPACGWELVDQIEAFGLAYHWDPVNLLSYVDQRVRNRTFRTADVIDELTDTGLRRGDEELWLSSDLGELYVVRGDHTDRYLADTDGLIVCTP